MVIQGSRSSGADVKSSSGSRTVETQEGHKKGRRAVRFEAPVPRLALRTGEAAAACGVSEDFFAAEIAPHVPCVRRGRLKLYPVALLATFLEDSAEQLLERPAA